MSYYQFVTATGVITVDTSDLLADVENEYRAAFGNDIALTPDTPQGVLVVAEVLARRGVLENVAAIANQINPNVAEGVFLDAIWALTGGQRQAATKTLVVAQLAGVPGAIIPAGAIAKTSDTDEPFSLAASVVLDGTGQATGMFSSVREGSVACNVGALSLIVTGVIGWESVTNPAAGVTGQALESDDQSRVRRQNTLALQGVSVSEAITSALYDIPGVRSVSYRENTTAAPVTIDGVNLGPHSIWACIDGGTDAEVAAALLAKKSAGCDWNGAVTVNVTDPYSGQVYPVTFDRPTDKAVLARVTLRPGVISNPTNAVKQAVVDYANGLIMGEPGFVLGADVSAFEIAAAVNNQLAGVFVQQVEVAFSTVTPVWQTLLPIEVFERATIDAASVSVVLV